MRSSSVGRRSSTIPVRISTLEREDKNGPRTESRKGQQLKPKISVVSSDGPHSAKPRVRASSSDRARDSTRGTFFKQTGKGSYVPTTPVTPAAIIRKTSNIHVANGSSKKNYLGLPTGPRSVSAERASTLGAKGPRKDTRPLTEKDYQMEMLYTIDNYFAANQCYSMLNSNGSLKPITLKMFVEVSGYLIKTLGVKLVLTNMNYVEELPKIAKKLHYPGVVTKSWLKTVNAMHSWPNVLGWISWLVQVCQIRDLAFENYNDLNLPFLGSESEADMSKRSLFSLLNSYNAWNDERLDEEAALVEKYLQEVADQQGVTDEDLAAARSDVEDKKEKFAIAEKNANDTDDEINQLNEMLASLEKNAAKQSNDIETNKEYAKSINMEADQIDTECRTMREQIRLLNVQKDELISIIKHQPMSTTERDEILAKCTEIENYMEQFEEHLRDIQKELYTLIIKITTLNQNLNKSVLAYNKEILLHITNDRNVDLNEFKISETSLSDPKIMEILKAKTSLMDNLKELLQKQLVEQERLLERETDEIEVYQERIKALEDDINEIADNLKEKKTRVNKIKTETKHKEKKLKEQIKVLQNDIAQIDESMPNVEEATEKLQKTRDKLDEVTKEKAYIEESAKLFFEEFYQIIGEHKQTMYNMLLEANKKNEGQFS